MKLSGNYQDSIFIPEIIREIFYKIPIKKRTRDLFLVNKILYGQINVFYDYFKLDFRDIMKYYSYYDESTRKNIKIMINVFEYYVPDNWTNDLRKTLNFKKYFPNLEELAFSDNFDEPIDNLILPDTIKILKLGHSFNQSVDNLALPRNLKKIKFGNHFCQNISDLKFPDGLQIIDLGGLSDNSIKNAKFPPNLLKLKMRYLYHISLLGIRFPEGLRELHLGGYFEESIDNFALPDNLIKFKVGINYEKPINKTHFLPNTLQELKLGFEYVQSKNYLDLLAENGELGNTNMKRLHTSVWAIGNNSPQNDFSHLKNLKKLKIDYGHYFFPPILPPTQPPMQQKGGIKKLRITFRKTKVSTYTFPDSIKYVEINNNNWNPDPIAIIRFQRYHSVVFTLPNSVEVFKLNNDLAIIQYFPKTLKKLYIDVDDYSNYPHNLEHLISLEKLVFGKYANPNIDDLKLPSNLKILKFGSNFDGSIESIEKLKLPDSLEILSMEDCEKCNYPINNFKLLKNLKYLSFGQEFNHPIDNVVFPEGLKVIKFGVKFNQPLNNFKIPPSLEKISFGGEFDKLITNFNFSKKAKKLIKITVNYAYSFDKEMHNPDNIFILEKNVKWIRRKYMREDNIYYEYIYVNKHYVQKIQNE